MADFDPYEDWLGIPRGIRPINHYLLLGIPVFESKADVIELACDQRMAMVRNFQSGPRGEFASQLLSELAIAKRVLQDDAQREYYDSEVRKVADDLNRSFEQQASQAGPESPVIPINSSVGDSSRQDGTRAVGQMSGRTAESEPSISVDPGEISEKVFCFNQPVDLEPSPIFSVKNLALFALVAGVAMLVTILVFWPRESARQQPGGQTVEQLAQPATVEPSSGRRKPKEVISQTSLAELLLLPSTALLEGPMVEEDRIGNWERSDDSAIWLVNVTDRRTGFFYCEVTYSALEECQFKIQIGSAPERTFTLYPQDETYTERFLVRSGEGVQRLKVTLVKVNEAADLLVHRIKLIPK